MTDPCIDQVPRDDPRIELIVNMVANAYGHRLPFKSASYATQHGRIDMARELLATLDKHDRNARGGSEGLMPTINATFVAMQDSVNRTVERIEMARRTGAVTPRPCCHTTGPHHHPACQESK